MWMLTHSGVMYDYLVAMTIKWPMAAVTIPSNPPAITCQMGTTIIIKKGVFQVYQSLRFLVVMDTILVVMDTKSRSINQLQTQINAIYIEDLRGGVAKKFTQWSALCQRMLRRKFIHNLIQNLHNIRCEYR